MRRALIATALTVTGIFGGAVAGGLLVRIGEIFMREPAGPMTYASAMVVGVILGGILGVAAATEVRP